MNPIHELGGLVARFAAIPLLVCVVHGAPLVKIRTVRVPDAGNAADPATGFGAVAEEFSIGKFEISLTEYTVFLNTVATNPAAPAHIQALYHPQMEGDTSVKGIQRQLSNGAYGYQVISDGGRPVTYVSWFDAARFCNWLHNGGDAAAGTETGAYTLSGASSGILSKKPDARWWIPTENEWYKAAYYKGGAPTGYWTYPTKSDTAPDNVIDGAPNRANFYDGAFTVSGNNSEANNVLTHGGAFTGSVGPYGTFDQAGNVWEWTDGAPTTYQRITRGGS